jgi:hypothetical protein
MKTPAAAQTLSTFGIQTVGLATVTRPIILRLMAARCAGGK